MLQFEYQYAIDYYSQEGKQLGSIRVEPDWGPARESAQFLAIRKGIIPPLLRDDAGSVEPVWDSELGAPVVGAARIVVAAEAGDETVCEEIRSVDYFRQLAKQGSTTMVERGLLEKGDLYRFKVCAYPGSASTGDTVESEPDGFGMEEIGERLPLEERPIEGLLAGARACGQDSDPGDMRVFIPQSLIDEVLEHSRAAGEVETGGVLVGKLYRCPATREIFLEATAQIPAPHTDATATRLTFNLESWAAVQAAIALRNLEELICGWWHFHPDFCRKCPEETRSKCLLGRPFFSSDDVHMHRVVFPRPYQQALLISDHGRESFEVNLFGWRHGMVSSRGFDVMGTSEAGDRREGRSFS